MYRIFLIVSQLILLVVLTSLTINYSLPVSISLNDIIITISSKYIILSLAIIILLVIFLQRIFFFFQKSLIKFNSNKKQKAYERGYHSFLQGMVALANKDFKKVISETKNVDKSFQNKSLGLLLRSEMLKIEKKFHDLYEVYEEMLNDPNTKLLGLRGLMEENLRTQDYHHAFIYGEKLFAINPNIDKLYDTLINIIGRTKNWQKLLEINEKSLKKKIISKNIYLTNKSIAFYEIAKIKKDSSIEESISLVEKAIKFRENFIPYLCFYVDLLINTNNAEKAKKVLKKSWSSSPHPELKIEIKKLASKMKISLQELSKFITTNTYNHPESKKLLAESFIQNEKWDEARNTIKSLLEHKPEKEICLLMAKIEEGISGDPQKINSWISRSNLGKEKKIWICQISGITQNEWSSVSSSGHFNSLKWQYPQTIAQFSSSGFEIDSLEYIGN